MNNDYELLYLAKEDEQVEEIISRKYKNLIDKKVRRYSDKNRYKARKITKNHE